MFKRELRVLNCRLPVQMEKLKWELDETANKYRYCLPCQKSMVYADGCSFNGCAKNGRGVGAFYNSYAVLADCAFHDLECAASTSWGGFVGIFGDNPTEDYSNNQVGICHIRGGLVLLGELVPDTLGGAYNTKDGMNAIIKGGKFI